MLCMDTKLIFSQSNNCRLYATTKPGTTKLPAIDSYFNIPKRLFHTQTFDSMKNILLQRYIAA